MLKDDEWICPRCGRILASLTHYHRHAEKEHGEKRAA